MLFVEGPTTREQLGRIGKELPPPLAVNRIEGGVTPLCSLEVLHSLGVDERCADDERFRPWSAGRGATGVWLRRR